MGMHFVNCLPGSLLENCRTPDLIWLGDINQVVGTRLFIQRWFGCSDIHTTVKQARIGGNDFASHSLSQAG
jgi:hypothetical protein